MDVPILIPAYHPDIALRPFVESLIRLGAHDIVVVDDGSSGDYASLFHQLRTLPQVTVLRHAINLGKGAALKTAINHVLCTREHLLGVVTADADGQHHADDVVKVGLTLEEQREKLILGVRRLPKRVFHSAAGSVTKLPDMRSGSLSASVSQTRRRACGVFLEAC
jgi:glycosyltransferase involved in cell wall biosynthesis